MGKKILYNLIMFLLLSCSAVTAVSVEAQAAGKKTAALKAYKKVLKKQQAEMSSYPSYARKEFAVKDINHDGTPELIINDWYTVRGYLYTYSGKKAVEVNEVHIGHGGFVFYKKGKVYGVGGMNYGYEGFYLCSIVKGKSKTLASYTDDSASLSANMVGPQYKIGKKNVSKKRYDAYVKKLTKNSKTIKLKFHKITNVNIKKYCK